MAPSLFLKSLIAVTLTTSVFAANLVLAEAPATAKVHNQHHKVVSRQTEKTKTDNGFVRTTTKTDQTGATAERTTTVVNNKVDGTRSRTVSGTTFEGKTYSGESVAHKTDNGFASEGQFTGPDGKTTSRSVTAVVDKSAGTVTKDISVTPEGGETTTKTVVTDIHHHRHEQ